MLNGGKAMSKSLGNGVDLGEQLDKYGVDAVRLTMIFAGPPEDDVDWADVSPSGSAKFLARAWRLGQDVASEPGVDVADRRPRPALGHPPHHRRRGRAAGRSLEMLALLGVLPRLQGRGRRMRAVEVVTVGRAASGPVST